MRFGMPEGRDPFVNVRLLSLGPGEDGHERFWTSSYNDVCGTTGVIVDELGRYRLYSFGPEHPGFYSVGFDRDEGVLWLCGWLDQVVRFRLEDGTWEAFDTGMKSVLVFRGMAFDPGTGKLFIATNGDEAITFDTRTRKTVGHLGVISRDGLYTRSSFANGDGTFTVVLGCPGLVFVRWDPRDDSVHTILIEERTDSTYLDGRMKYTFVAAVDGRRFVPGHGWFNPRTWKMEEHGPRPERPMSWFARRGSLVYGTEDLLGDPIHEWDLNTGKVRKVCAVPDATVMGMNISSSGKLVAVSHDGVFYRMDAVTGAMECSCPLPVTAVGRVDCMVKIDQERLLGTYFITQRFWEFNLATDRGFDCGKAAPGTGEILLSWKIGNKVYMAAYTGGELLEYDPGRPPHFPENPTVVATPPRSLRPVAGTDDGQALFYACSAPSGERGSVLTKYDTRTGVFQYVTNPLPGQQIVDLAYDHTTGTLLAGTTYRGESVPEPEEAERICWFARIDADDLSVIAKFPARKSTVRASVHGPCAEGRFLCSTRGDGDFLDPPKKHGTFLFTLSANEFRSPYPGGRITVPGSFADLQPAGAPGKFILRNRDRLELWHIDTPSGRMLEVLHQGPDVQKAYLIIVQDSSIYLAVDKEVVILEECITSDIGE